MSRFTQLDYCSIPVGDVDAMLEHLESHDVSVWELPNSPTARRQIWSTWGVGTR